MTHEERIVEFLQTNPDWRRVGLRREINKVLQEDEEPLGFLSFVPDAFRVRSRQVDLLEVEGHSYIDQHKLRRLLDFWLDMDSRSWFVTLTVISSFTGATSYLTDKDFERLFWDAAYAVA